MITKLKVVGAASMSVDFFLLCLHNMLGYTELNVNTTKNHRSHFANPSFKNAVLLEIPLGYRKTDNVSIVTTACASMFKPAIFVHRGSRTYRLVTVMLVHISITST